MPDSTYHYELHMQAGVAGSSLVNVVTSAGECGPALSYHNKRLLLPDNSTLYQRRFRSGDSAHEHRRCLCVSPHIRMPDCFCPSEDDLLDPITGYPAYKLPDGGVPEYLALEFDVTDIGQLWTGYYGHFRNNTPLQPDTWLYSIQPAILTAHRQPVTGICTWSTTVESEIFSHQTVPRYGNNGITPTTYYSRSKYEFIFGIAPCEWVEYFSIDPETGEYYYEPHTTGWGVGGYTLRVVAINDDGSEHYWGPREVFSCAVGPIHKVATPPTPIGLKFPLLNILQPVECAIGYVQDSELEGWEVSPEEKAMLFYLDLDNFNLRGIA